MLLRDLPQNPFSTVSAKSGLTHRSMGWLIGGLRRRARAALDARAPAERADGRGEEVARGGSPRGVVRVTRPGAYLSPAPPARRRPRGRPAAPPRRRARFGHRAL